MVIISGDIRLWAYATKGSEFHRYVAISLLVVPLNFQRSPSVLHCNFFDSHNHSAALSSLVPGV
jgi:hypothetical protein